MHLGVALGSLFIILRGRGRADLLPRWPALAAFALVFVAWGLDGLNSALSLWMARPLLYEPNNALRLLTGTLEGLGIPLLAWPLAARAFWQETDGRRIASLPEVCVLFAVGSALSLALSQPWPILRYAAALVAPLSLLWLLTLLNVQFYLLISRRIGVLTGRSQFLKLLAWSLLPALAELSAGALLRRWLLKW
jgi:hypothetical protein